MSNQFLEQIVVGAKVDTKGFKKADTALAKLGKTVKGVAGAVGIAYGASAITAYGKAAVKAFADDEAAALRLNRAVTNLGISFANPAISDYISKLEKSSAIADDILRPSFQSLLTTTGSLTKSQELLNNAITISRASGIDLATVTSDLAKGYVGITKGLSKYNTGLTKAELQSKSFSDILGVLLKRSAGAAEDYLGSTAYSMDVLSVATSNASEIIGGGLVDAFAAIGGGTEASDAATAIEAVAGAIANVEVAIGKTIGAIPNLLKNLKNLPKNIFQGFAGKAAGVTLSTQAKEKVEVSLSEKRQQELLAKLEAAAVKRNKELLALKNKQVAADKNKAAIAKANLALGKSTDVFDLDKIQLAAAEVSQAEQLGKVTSQAQLLQITNDLARLRVKQDILALEDAIASGDVKAIGAATAKLNADTKILGALTGQDLKLKEIQSTLEKIVPADLINLDNLNEAIRLLGVINAPTVTSGATTNAGAITSTATVDPRAALQKLTSGQSLNAAEASALGVPDYASFNPDMVGMTSKGVAPSSTNLNVTVNTGVGDPNAIAEAITQVVREAQQRGTLTGAMGTL